MNDMFNRFCTFFMDDVSAIADFTVVTVVNFQYISKVSNILCLIF